LYRKQSTVARIFSVHHPVTEQLKFPPEFLDRIKELEYKHLLFLPAGDALPVDSILRLDEVQSVFSARLDSTGITLHKDVKDLLRSQLQCMINNEHSGYYQLYRDEILKAKS